METVTKIQSNLLLLEEIRHKYLLKEITNGEALKFRLETKKRIEDILNSKEFLLGL